MKILFWVACCILLSFPVHSSEKPEIEEHSAEIVVYGGTSAGVIAAVKAAKLGRSVLLVSPDKHLGGMSSSGLGFTDSGNIQTIGGLSREFFRRIYTHYSSDTAWNLQSREDYGGKGQGTAAIHEETKTMWVFEPHVAEKIFNDMLTEEGITVLKEEWLDRDRAVETSENAITAFYTLSGKKITGKMFIDATYEGDLMAASGVSYTFGREANAEYDEKYNGVQKELFHHHHSFHPLKIDPYIKKGDPGSGLLPKIAAEAPGRNGSADAKIEAYCFRLCLTKNPENKIAIKAPEGYDPKDYELLGRIYEKRWKKTFSKFDPIPNLKTDVNNHGPFSMDNIGMNYEYPEASYEKRREIVEEHKRYQQGLLFFTGTDKRVPKKIRQEMLKWGYAKDEFQDNGGFPYQLYIREARRMIGDYVMTEHDIMGDRETPNSIGMGSYNLDSHNVQRYVTEKGFVENEGDVGVRPEGPYSIAMGTILPKVEECKNLIVPVCVSSSHIAYGSIRMEPVFMILAESASQIADLALENDEAVQEISYTILQDKLESAGVILKL